MIRIGRDLVHRLIELDRGQFLVGVYQDGRQSIRSPPDEHMIGKTHRRYELPTGLMGNHLGEAASPHRNGREPAVFALIVDDNPEDIITMIDRVLHTLDAWQNHSRFSCCIIGRNDPCRLGDGRVCRDNDETTGTSLTESKEETIVVFLDHEDIIRLVHPHLVSPDLMGPQRFVCDNIEKMRPIA